MNKKIFPDQFQTEGLPLHPIIYVFNPTPPKNKQKNHHPLLYLKGSLISLITWREVYSTVYVVVATAYRIPSLSNAGWGHQSLKKATSNNTKDTLFLEAGKISLDTDTMLALWRDNCHLLFILKSQNIKEMWSLFICIYFFCSISKCEALCKAKHLCSFPWDVPLWSRCIVKDMKHLISRLSLMQNCSGIDHSLSDWVDCLHTSVAPHLDCVRYRVLPSPKMISNVCSTGQDTYTFYGTV